MGRDRGISPDAFYPRGTVTYAQSVGQGSSMAKSTKGGGLDGRTVAAVILAAIALIFVLENTRDVKIRFIIPEVKSPLAVALIVSLLLGVVAGWLLARRRGGG